MCENHYSSLKGHTRPTRHTGHTTTTSQVTGLPTDFAEALITCPTLATKNVTPHTLRHTTAMQMLAAGIDITTIPLWLGHESTNSTQPYLHANLGIKQRALDRITPRPGPAGRRYQPDDQLLTFLEAL